MGTIKQITDTTGVTHDIGCKWENIEKPEYIETPILHLKITDENNGGKIIFGDMGDGFENHDEHYACIEEIDDDVLNFRATSFNFEGDIIGSLTGNATTATTATNVKSNTTTSVYYLCGTTNASTNTSGTLVKNTNAFVDTNGCLYSGGKKVLTDGDGDTKNTAGASTTASKIYLVGATATSVSAQTYSNASVYATNGALTATTFVVAGTKATTSSRITSDASYNLYFTVGGKTPLVLADDDSSNIFVAPGSSYSNRYSLGTSTRLWKNVYASTFYGNSTTATTATTAKNVKVSYIDTLTNVSTNISYYPVFVNGAGDSKTLYDTSKIVFVPSTGTVSASGGFYETSDEQLKEIIKPVDVDLNKIKKLRKIYFDWKDESNHKHQIGMIAQDVRELYPEIVSESEEGQLSLAYDKLSVIALGAIDVLHNENIELKNRIEKLENFVNQLSEKINN